MWLNADIMANFRKEIGHDIMDFIMAYDGGSTCGASQSMLCVEGGSADTFTWKVGGCPAVT